MALLFADQTQVRLHQNTVLQVKALATAGQGTTTLRLEAGRAWTQTRRPPGSPLELQTPAATAAIRGTDWHISVEPNGRTLLTVLSGTVEFGNPQGTLTLSANEAAYAEVGKAPVKLMLVQPRESVQWVNALQPDPLPHLAAEPLPAALEPVRAALAAGPIDRARSALAQTRAQAPASWGAALELAIALQAGQWPEARALAQQQMPQRPPLPVWLMQSDLLLMGGEGQAAVATLQGAPLAIGLAGNVLVAMSIADPLRQLRWALGEVQRGNYNAHMQIYDASELGLLQAGFNDMVRDLSERQRLRDLFGRYVGEDVARRALERGAKYRTQLEINRIFRPSWQVVCHVGDIPDHGDWHSLDYVGESVIVVRGKDNEVRAFTNVCRHRGSRLLKDACGSPRSSARTPRSNWDAAAPT